MLKTRRDGQKFEALLLACASIVWWTNPEGEFVEEQPSWQDYTGQSWEEYRGSGWGACVHPDDREALAADWTAAVTSGSLYFTQGRIWSAKHRAYRAFQTRGILIKNANGQIEEWFGALTDIQDSIEIGMLFDNTRQDLAESLKALRLSEAKAQHQLEELRAIEEVLRESEARLAREATALHGLKEASSRLWQMRDLSEGLNEILRSVIELLGADKGNIQLLDSARVLTIAAQQGFEQPFLDVFKEVSAEDDLACGRALRLGRRIIIEDVAMDQGFAPYRAAAVAAGFRSVQTTPLFGHNGAPLGMLSTHFRRPHHPAEHELHLLDLFARQAADFIERLQKDEQLRESEERHRGIFENTPTGIAIADLEGRFQSCNPAYASMLGYSTEEIGKLAFATTVHREDLGRHLSETGRLLAGEINSFKVLNRSVRKDGSHIWVHRTVSLLRDNGGRPRNIIALISDLTEQKRKEERIELLMREVNHRSKNILTLVQAIAMQTARRSPGDFVSRFNERLCALAASHDLLVRSEWKKISLEELIRSQLAHFKDLIGTRLVLTGPPISVSAEAAQALGMTFHELATNAGKYGALSNQSGCVEVAWQIEQDPQGSEAFRISWRESGGPAVKVPASGGFGTVIMCEMAEGSLDAKADLAFPPAGLAWELQCALDVIGEKAGATISPVCTPTDWN